MAEENGLAAEEAADAKKPGNGRRLKGVAVALLLAACAAFGVQQWVKGKTRIETDNAFVESHVYSVSSRIPATVQRIAVADNQLVRKGDLLIQLDPSDHEARVNTAAAAVAVAQNETSGEYALAEGAKAAVGLAAARLEQTEKDLKRGKALFEKDVIPREQLERFMTAEKVARMQLKEAEEARRRAEAVIGLNDSGAKDARVTQKKAQLSEARLGLSYTRIKAPCDGFVTRRSAEPGNNVQPGQPLMAIVSLDKPWITANYKESQLSDVRPGQRVRFTVDAYPGHVFNGSVESVMAGTGAAFSLLPPENASGNYVKVIQRIPVRIAIEKGGDPKRPLRVGMSVIPTILVDKSFLDVVTRR